MMLISELIDGDREKWTKNELARTAEGSPVHANHPEASSWCLLGMALKCYSGSECISVVGKLSACIAPKHATLSTFNDAPETTFEDVLSVVTRANV